MILDTNACSKVVLRSLGVEVIQDWILNSGSWPDKGALLFFKVFFAQASPLNRLSVHLYLMLIVNSV